MLGKSQILPVFAELGKEKVVSVSSGFFAKCCRQKSLEQVKSSAIVTFSGGVGTVRHRYLSGS